jgi:catechol 2,3-dioxygenase-like lactoylglutathione lyase family enzyme
MIENRRDHEQPSAVAELGWRYHHVGIPYTVPHPEEKHLDHLGVHVHGFQTSPYGIEWMRFELHCRVPEVVRTFPHLAFAVDNLDEALRGRDLLIEPNAPSDGVRVAFILHDGAPVELLEFRAPEPQHNRHALSLRFDCIFYYVSDLDRAIRFYTTTLGFQLSSRDAVARFFVDGVLFELVPASNSQTLSGQGNARLTLAVDKIDAAARELQAKGVPVSDVQRVSNGRFVSLADPDGNEIVLWEYL